MLTIHSETPEDIESIRRINQQAFGQVEEANIIDKLRARGILTLSLVATLDNRAVGHIAFSPVVIEAESSSFEGIALAPMAVLPEYQKQGIGAELIRAGIKECRKLGYEVVVVLGHQSYYPRFGFTPAKTKGIICEFEVPDEAFMVLEIRDGALAGRGGTVKFQPEFQENT